LSRAARKAGTAGSEGTPARQRAGVTRLLLRHPAQLLTPDDFEDLDSLAAQILAFEQHYNTTARPFDWKFTRTDLNQLLTRLGRHDPAAPRPLAA
jgi:hypothetical protein